MVQVNQSHVALVYERDNAAHLSLVYVPLAVVTAQQQDDKERHLYTSPAVRWTDKLLVWTKVQLHALWSLLP